jgi:hypothetical protein
LPSIYLHALALRIVVLANIETEVEHTMIDEVGRDEGGKKSGCQFHHDVVEIDIWEFAET